MKFQYSAKTRDGSQNKKGEIEAPNQKSAIRMLRNKNLVVYSMVATGKQTNLLGIFEKLKGVSLGDKVKFTEQLASMTTAGLPLTKALDILVTQTGNKQMSEIIDETLADVESGMPLSTALEKYPKVFDQSYVSLLKAGEKSGKLSDVLSKQAKTMEKQRKFKSEVKGAMIYPIIVLSTMAVVFVLIMILVIPKMATMYESLNVELPVLTQVLISISNFMVNSWWIMILGFAGTVYGIRFFANTPYGKYFFAGLFLKLPIFGNLNKKSNLVEFTQTLGLLSEAGVPIVEGLEIAQYSMGNLIYQDAVNNFIDDVKHGYPLSQSIAKKSIFPSLVSDMLVVGEETGTVAERLNGLSTYFENEVDKIVKNLSTAMEPLIMIMLGIMVALLILSVITPIYQLTSQF